MKKIRFTLRISDVLNKKLEELTNKKCFNSQHFTRKSWTVRSAVRGG